MKNKAYHEKVIADVTRELKAQGIDAYLILTGDGQDPMPLFIPGVDTVGNGAYLFTAGGRALAITSGIDAQDVEESGLFERVGRYQDYDTSLVELLLETSPKVLALDYSQDVPGCDGLTVGRYEHFMELMRGRLDFKTVSADRFIPKVMDENPA